MSEINFLAEALSLQGILATKQQLDQLCVYVSLILEWNKVYNLTAARSFDEIVSKHVVDSLSVLPYLPKLPCSLLDVGSGAGFPGVPLSIMCPDMSCCLLDSQEKRCIFLSQVRSEVGLSNLDVEWSRLEDFRSSCGYNLIISRAFSSLAEFVFCSSHLRCSDGCWYAMKGRYPEEEVKLLPREFVVEEWWPIKLAGIDVCRCLLRIGFR